MKRRIDRFEAIAHVYALRERACLSSAADFETEADAIDRDPERTKSASDLAAANRARVERLRIRAAAWREQKELLIRACSSSVGG